jgi:hypothetical protein
MTTEAFEVTSYAKRTFMLSAEMNIKVNSAKSS